jgi:hypothetical protein
VEGKPLPPAGWYSDPEQPQTQRYWNGEQWTDQRAPMAPKQEDKGAGVLVVVSYLAALFIPIIGFILGIVLLVRRQTGHGLAVVLISVAVGIAACALFLEDTEEELERAGEDIGARVSTGRA